MLDQFHWCCNNISVTQKVPPPLVSYPQMFMPASACTCGYLGLNLLVRICWSVLWNYRHIYAKVTIYSFTDVIKLTELSWTLPFLPRWLGVIFYMTFLFLVIVVLLNLLIAQMSDTYANVQLDAQRSLAINRAWIVARVEHNALLATVRIPLNLESLTRLWLIE